MTQQLIFYHQILSTSYLAFGVLLYSYNSLHVAFQAGGMILADLP